MIFPVLENGVSYSSQPYPITNITVSNGLILANVVPYQDGSIGSYTGSYVLATPSLQYLFPWVSIGSNFIVPNTGDGGTTSKSGNPIVSYLNTESGPTSKPGNPIVSYFETSLNGHNCGVYISVDPAGTNWLAYATDLNPTSDNVSCPFVGNNLYRWQNITGSYVSSLEGTLASGELVTDIRVTNSKEFYAITNLGHLFSDSNNYGWQEISMQGDSNLGILQLENFNDDNYDRIFALLYLPTYGYQIYIFSNGAYSAPLYVDNPVAMNIINKDNTGNSMTNQQLVVMDMYGGYTIFDGSNFAYDEPSDYIPNAYYNGFTLAWPQQLNLQCGVNFIPPTASEATNQSAKVDNSVVNLTPDDLQNYSFLYGLFVNRAVVSGGLIYNFIDLTMLNNTTRLTTVLLIPVISGGPSSFLWGSSAVFNNGNGTANFLSYVFFSLTPVDKNNNFTVSLWTLDQSTIFPARGAPMSEFPNLNFDANGSPYITINPSLAHPAYNFQVNTAAFDKQIPPEINEFFRELPVVKASDRVFFASQFQNFIRRNIAKILGYGIAPEYDPGPMPSPSQSPPPPPASGATGILPLPANTCMSSPQVLASS